MANICCNWLKNETEFFSSHTKGASVSHFHNNKPVFTDEESFMARIFKTQPIPGHKKRNSTKPKVHIDKENINKLVIENGRKQELCSG